jgi:hypothetical protein
MAVAPALYRNVGYDPIKSFAPVVMIARSHQILIVNPAVPAKSVQELVAYAKGNPSKVHFGSPASEPEWCELTARPPGRGAGKTGRRRLKNESGWLQRKIESICARQLMTPRYPK